VIIVVDIEADGPIPGPYSMISIGAVVAEPGLNRTFYGELAPISEKWQPEALSISGFSREQTLGFRPAVVVMAEFTAWLSNVSQGQRITFFSDNLSFDWMFTCWYLHTFCGANPFGWSGRRIGDIICGLEKNYYYTWKHLRATKHTHHPVEDAQANASVLLKLADIYNFKLPK
jgi:hypothetical protein